MTPKEKAKELFGIMSSCIVKDRSLLAGINKRNKKNMKQMDHIGDTNKMVTAVEWLIEQLENVDYNPLEKGGYDTAKKRIIEHAKAMEKEQIINAIDSQYNYDSWLKELPTLGEQYYNETYNK